MKEIVKFTKDDCWILLSIPNTNEGGLLYEIVVRERLALDSGYHPTYISYLETGKYSPSLEAEIKLSRSLGVEITELLEPFVNGEG